MAQHHNFKLCVSGVCWVPALWRGRPDLDLRVGLRAPTVSWCEHCAFSLPVHDLRQQMTALQSQLRQVQLERTTLTSRLKASQAEIASLQSVRQWYQQQLALAQEARVRLQGEMAHIQV